MRCDVERCSILPIGIFKFEILGKLYLSGVAQSGILSNLASQGLYLFYFKNSISGFLGIFRIVSGWIFGELTWDLYKITVGNGGQERVLSPI